MVPTLPPPTDLAAPRNTSDMWASTRAPQPNRHPVVDDDVAPIDRPRVWTVQRGLALIAAATLVALALFFTTLGETDAIPVRSLRAYSLFVVGGYLLSLAAFAVWSHRQRMIIDQLRWRSFRRPTWSGWWGVGWVATPLVVGALAVLVPVLTATRWWFLGIAVATIAVRMMSLQSLGTNMSRVVRGAKRWLLLWAIVMGVVDMLVIDLAITALIETTVDAQRIEHLVNWMMPIFLLNGLLTASYMQRVERWVLEWWDHRYGISDEELLAVLLVVEHQANGPAEFAGRRMVPVAPLRALVIAAYLAVAGASMWVGWEIWLQRDDLPLASDVGATIDQIDSSAWFFVAALLAVQVTHGLWSIASAWNAKRCTLKAPSALGMLVLFLVGPAFAVTGFLVSDDYGHRLTFVAMAILLNLTCWALSFNVLGNTLSVLGRSDQMLGAWAGTVALHWVLLFLIRPLDAIENDLVYAWIAMIVSAVDATIFVVASVMAWRAMRHFEQATRDFEQVRRVSV